MIPILLLAVIQTLALGLRYKNRNSAASWILASGLLLMVGIITAGDLPVLFTPTTEELQRFRDATFFAHLRLAGVELAILIFAIISSASRSKWGRPCFWSGWWLNLVVMAVLFYLEASGRGARIAI